MVEPRKKNNSHSKFVQNELGQLVTRSKRWQNEFPKLSSLYDVMAKKFKAAGYRLVPLRHPFANANTPFRALTKEKGLNVLFRCVPGLGVVVDVQLDLEWKKGRETTLFKQFSIGEVTFHALANPESFGLLHDDSPIALAQIADRAFAYAGTMTNEARKLLKA